jgi:hypothetical protein
MTQAPTDAHVPVIENPTSIHYGHKNTLAIPSPSHSGPNGLARMQDHAALGNMFHTPDQAAFRRAARGWDSDVAQYGDRHGHPSLSLIRYDPTNGAVTTTELDRTDASWIDPGGSNGPVMGAGRP